MNPQIAFLPLARTTFDIELARQVTQVARSRLENAGMQLLGPQELISDLPTAQALIRDLAQETVDLILIFQATFADSTLVTTLVEENSAPVFLWAVPEPRTGGRLRLNSLCGINLAGHALTLRGRRYEYTYAAPDDQAAAAEAIDQIKALAAAGQIVRRLKSARLGVVGEHPAGMDSCHLDEPRLQDRLGLRIVRIELEQVFERARQLQNIETLAPVRAALDVRLNNLDELEQTPLLGTLSVYTALSQIAADLHLDGLAVRCWPEFFTEMGCAACGAMSLLTEGFQLPAPIPCSCEADINGTVTQLILQWLAGEPVFGSDLVAMDFAEDIAVLWHCGLAPFSMADPTWQLRGGIHSNRKVPLVMEFPLKPGKLTLARLNQSLRSPDGSAGDLRLVLGQAEMLASQPSFSGTSGVMRFERPARQVLDTIMSEGLEHHVSLAYGNYLPELQALARLLNMPTLHL